MSDIINRQKKIKERKQVFHSRKIYEDEKRRIENCLKDGQKQEVSKNLK